MFLKLVYRGVRSSAEQISRKIVDVARKLMLRAITEGWIGNIQGK